jgi:hypothetical protein
MVRLMRWELGYAVSRRKYPDFDSHAPWAQKQKMLLGDFDPDSLVWRAARPALFGHYYLGAFAGMAALCWVAVSRHRLSSGPLGEILYERWL